MNTLRTRLRKALQSIRGQRIRILNYHSVSDQRRDTWSIGVNHFADHMRYLRETNVNVIGLGEAIAQLQTGSIQPRSVVITFDDGYLDFLWNALPILQTYDLPATLFIPVNKIGQTSAWSKTTPDEMLMNWDQLDQVQQAGVCIGSHGMDHPRFPQVSDAVLQNEIHASRAYLQQRYRLSAIDLAYPFGDHHEREIHAARQNGYRSAAGFGGIWGNGADSDLFSLQRDPIKRGHTVSTLRNILNGIDDWLEIIRALQRKL
jgi:peptidoglycan/xylan/chitin deacetylase (PgdA/CDA1 family)